MPDCISTKEVRNFKMQTNKKVQIPAAATLFQRQILNKKKQPQKTGNSCKRIPNFFFQQTRIQVQLYLSKNDDNFNKRFGEKILAK